ncbi:hypothetical protein [Streptomyces jumonjinensis]|uniref:hypothetical protein n=1 Tax=Streptomyces jumonjinensis TaxID=1945 RepID=UPI0037975A26
MRIRHGAKGHRAATAVLVAAALSLSLTACGGGDDGSDRKNTGAESTQSGPEQPKQPSADEGAEGAEEPGAGATLAVIKGANGFEFTISAAERDEGGFLTLSGTVKNISSGRKIPPVQWNGQENQVKRTGPSLGGVTLIDKAGKKRYYVLRDTEGYPLTTTGLGAFEAGASVDFFAQFPAPPEETEALDLQIPLMPSATIEIG